MKCKNDSEFVDMTVAQAINKIIEQCGIDILKSPHKVQAMIKDYVGGYEVEKQLFLFSCQKDILNYAQHMLLLEDDSKRKEVANQAKENLKQNAFMSEEYAILSVNIMLEGLSMDFKLVREDTEKNVINENEKDKPNLNGKIQYEKYEEILSMGNETKTNENMIKNLKKSANYGDIDALIFLGDCYKCGNMVEMDWILAELYYRKAEEAGSQEAKRKRQRLLFELSAMGYMLLDEN